MILSLLMLVCQTMAPCDYHTALHVFRHGDTPDTTFKMQGTITGSVTAGSDQLTGVANPMGLANLTIIAPALPEHTKILLSGTQGPVQLSAPATADFTGQFKVGYELPNVLECHKNGAALIRGLYQQYPWHMIMEQCISKDEADAAGIQ